MDFKKLQKKKSGLPPKNDKKVNQESQELQKDASQVITTKNTPGFKPIIRSAAELQRMNVKPPTFIIKDILLEQGSIIFSGEPKVGKTNLFTFMALSLAEGWPAFGSIPVKKKYKVLFLALEDNDSRMKLRLTAIYDSKGIKKWSENFTYLLDFPNMKNGGLEALIKTIQTYDPDIIAIDTLEYFIARGGKESYSGDYQIATTVQSLTKAFKDKSFVILHHTRKAKSDSDVQKISGSHGISGSLDNFWLLKRQGTQIIFSVGGRDLYPGRYVLSYDQETYTWAIEGRDFEVAKSKEQNEVLNALKNSEEGLTLKELCDVTDVKKGAMKTRLFRMKRDLLIDKDQDKRYFIFEPSKQKL